MKLLIENINDARILKEEIDGNKNYFIEGIFLQSKPNRNGRLYPIETLAEEVRRYNEKFVEKRRAFGEFRSSTNAHYSNGTYISYHYRIETTSVKIS